MDISLKQVTIGEVYEGYINDGENENGVTGYDDNLNIRPKYQRNYVYKDNKRDEVVRTVLKKFPLNVFYWVDLGDAYEDEVYLVRARLCQGRQVLPVEQNLRVLRCGARWVDARDAGMELPRMRLHP